MRALNVFLAMAVSVLLGLGIFNLGLSFIPAFKSRQQINQFDPKLGWSKKPNTSVDRTTGEFDITFDINALGLRDDPMANTDKGANTFRVLMLGDSFVLGYTVDRENLFVDQLEHWWSAEERRVDVINAGTEGYSTDQEVAWFLDTGVDFDPDLVLLFPYENDIYWNGQDKYNRFPKPRFSADGTRETGTLADPGAGSEPNWAILRFLNMFKKGKTGPLPDHFTTPGLADKQLYKEWAPLLTDEPPFLADCMTRTKGSLVALRDKCSEIGAGLIMIPVPSESVIHADAREAFRTNPRGLAGLADELWDPNKPVDAFLGMARELGIQTLDPRSTLKAAGEDETLYFDAEWHFNVAGNEVFTRFLHDNLDSMGAFPEAHGANKDSDLVAVPEAGGIPTWLMLFSGLWIFLGTSFCVTYPKESAPLSFLKVGALLSVIFSIAIGGSTLLAFNPAIAPIVALTFVAVILTFVVYKLGNRLATIFELMKAFTLRGHWYLMPLVVVLLSIGSLLVVAASSPLVAPFIYTLF